MNDEEREYLNEMIRSLNNRLVDALRERDEARLQVERCKTIIDDYIKDIATQKAALMQARTMMAKLHSKIQEFEAREQ